MRPLMMITGPLVALAMMVTAAAAATEDTAKAFVQGLADRVIQVLEKNGNDTAARQAEFRDIFARNADVEAIGKFATGRYWRAASEEEKRAYLDFFADYVSFMYATRIDAYAGEKLEVERVIDAGAKGLIVKSRIVRAEGPPVQVDWRLRATDGGFKVIDLIVEQVSMAQTQQSEFTSILARNGGKLPALVEELKPRVAGL
ncbi:MlaC/ttg2D family ABC transporter substrate-binding protein [Futiania mangrovi]|uniref:ABC transporter substrate-binding protein n=1 Tax=Futiania mangrovi TaxID=2959716 RepID=A0A9J6P9K0_9PROT|nr:ABC transporter substrate-binding protein [Futiania mangrovii]MCP1334937.1 ABC transporter substrate-binding protein [Futiania mangrovii]